MYHRDLLSVRFCNILLDVLDKELERRNLKYVRYADDFSIYTKSKREARKVGNEIYLFLRDKLRLPINRETPEHESAKGAHEVLASEDPLTSNCWDMHLFRHTRKESKENTSWWSKRTVGNLSNASSS